MAVSDTLFNNHVESNNVEFANRQILLKGSGLPNLSTDDGVINTPIGTVYLNLDDYARFERIGPTNADWREMTTDLTPAEIKSLYESNADTNAFTDADVAKLSGIEPLADVTDSINVAAAGATMNNQTDVSGSSWVVDEDDLVSDSDTQVPTQQSVKSYVDFKTAGVGAFWTSVKVVSEAEIDISTGGLLTIDGETLLNDDRVLLINQSGSSDLENGIYLAKAGSWVRALDADEDSEFKTNKTVSVSSGSLGAGRVYAYTGDDDPAIDTDAITYTLKEEASAVADGSITTAKLANDAVTNDKIADNAVDTDQIVNDAVTNDKIDSVNSDKITGTILNVNADAGPTGLYGADSTIDFEGGDGVVTNTDAGKVVFQVAVSEEVVTTDITVTSDSNSSGVSSESAGSIIRVSAQSGGSTIALSPEPIVGDIMQITDGNGDIWRFEVATVDDTTDTWAFRMTAVGGTIERNGAGESDFFFFADDIFNTDTTTSTLVDRVDSVGNSSFLGFDNGALQVQTEDVVTGSTDKVPTSSSVKAYVDAAQAASTGMDGVTATFTHTDGTLDIGDILPVGAIVLSSKIVITTAFDGTAPTLTIGTTLSSDAVQTTALNDPTTVGTYANELAWTIDGDRQLEIDIVPDGSTQGGGVVVVEYLVV